MLGIICCDLYTGFCVQNDKASKHLRRSSVAAALISGNITRLDYCQNTHLVEAFRVVRTKLYSTCFLLVANISVSTNLQALFITFFLGGNLHFGVTNEYRLRPNKNFQRERYSLVVVFHFLKIRTRCFFIIRSLYV